MYQNPAVQNAGTIFKVVRAIFQESGTYNDQVARNYQLQNFESFGGSNPLLQNLSTAIHQGANLSSNLLAQHSYQFLAPQAQVSQSNYASIENGWNTRRLWFMMELHVVRPLSNVVDRYVLSGYTDYFDPPIQTGPSMALDPNMKLFINNVVQLRQVNVMNGGVQQTSIMPGEMLQVLIGKYQAGSGFAPGINNYSLRPIDLAEVNSSLALAQTSNIQKVHDTTITFCNGPKVQSRNNNCANRYMSKYLNGYVAAHAEDKLGNNDNQMADVNFANSMVGAVGENNANDNPVLMLIGNATQFSNPNRGYITWGELAAIDNSVLDDRVTKVNINSGAAMRHVHQAGSTAFLTAADNHSVAVSLILQMVPSMMVPCHLTRVTFTVTNMTVDGMPDVQIHWNQNPNDRIHFTPCSFIEGIDLSNNLRDFIVLIKTELVPALSKGGSHIFAATIDAKLLNDMTIKITMDHAAPEDFCVPIGADHLFAPILTGDYNQVVGMAQDMNILANEIIDTNSLIKPMMGGSNLNGGFGSI